MVATFHRMALHFLHGLGCYITEDGNAGQFANQIRPSLYYQSLKDLTTNVYNSLASLPCPLFPSSVYVQQAARFSHRPLPPASCRRGRREVGEKIFKIQVKVGSFSLLRYTLQAANTVSTPCFTLVPRYCPPPSSSPPQHSPPPHGSSSQPEVYTLLLYYLGKPSLH